MSDNGDISDSSAHTDGAASEGLTSGRAGDVSHGTGTDQGERSSHSYSFDPVTGERLGGDLSERYNDEAAVGATATDVGESGQDQGDRSTGTSDTGSNQTSAAGADAELPDYAKETYRTEDDERQDNTHSSSHGLTHGM